MAKRSSDPRVGYPEFKVQVRDLVRIVGMVDPFAPRGGGGLYLGEIRFIEPQEVNVLCRVPQAAVRHGRARQSSWTGPCGDCRRVPWIPGPRGQYSGINSFIEKLQEGGRLNSLCG